MPPFWLVHKVKSHCVILMNIHLKILHIFFLWDDIVFSHYFISLGMMKWDLMGIEWTICWHKHWVVLSGLNSVYLGTCWIFRIYSINVKSMVKPHESPMIFQVSFIVRLSSQCQSLLVHNSYIFFCCLWLLFISSNKLKDWNTQNPGLGMVRWSDGPWEFPCPSGQVADSMDSFEPFRDALPGVFESSVRPAESCFNKKNDTKPRDLIWGILRYFLAVL